MSTRSAAALLASLTFVLAAAACGTAPRRSDEAPPAAGAESELPAYRLRTVDGRTLDLAEHIGKDVILLNFWATWCKPCRGEFPFLQRLHERYAADGLLVLVVSVDAPETHAEVRPFLQRNRYTMPAVIDRNGRIAARLNPRAAVPLAHIYDRAGRRHRTHEGFQLGERDAIEAEIKELLAPPPAEGGAGEPAAPSGE